MAENDPFQRYIPLDETNALKVNIHRLKSEDLPTDFNAAIDTLESIRDTLKTIEPLGRLQELGQIQFYLDALRWLHSEMALSNFVGVPQIPSRASIDGNIAMQFKQYVQIYLGQLRSNVVYSAIEASQIVKNQSATKRAAEQADIIVDDVEKQSEKLATSAIERARNEITGLQQPLTDSLNQMRTEVTQLSTNAHESLESEVVSAVGRVQAAQALQQWGATYDTAIAEYKYRLFGPKWGSGTLTRNLHALRRVWHGSIKKKRPVWGQLIKSAGLTLWLLLKNAIGLTSFIFRKSISYSGRRSVWFAVIAIFVVVFVGLTTFMLIIMYTDVVSIREADLSSIKNADESQLYLKLTVFLPVAVILGLAYSFAIKNFRIYSNMLDQYEHRRTVAYTAQGIILSLKETGDADLRSQVTAAASAALFEHKNTGHLNKKEGETLGLFDLLSMTQRR